MDDKIQSTQNFILSLPLDAGIYFPIWDGVYKNHNTENILLKDPLSDFIRQPIFHPLGKSVTHKAISNAIESYQLTGNYLDLQKIGIKYIVLNRINANSNNFLNYDTDKNLDVIFNNLTYTVYKIKSFDMKSIGNVVDPKVFPEVPELVFKKYADTLYHVKANNVPDYSFELELIKANSYHWKLFCYNGHLRLRSIPRLFISIMVDDIQIEPSSCFEEKEDESIFNKWRVTSNEKNVSNLNIILFFRPQIILYLLMIISILGLFIFSFIIYRRK